MYAQLIGVSPLEGIMDGPDTSTGSSANDESTSGGSSSTRDENTRPTTTAVSPTGPASLQASPPTLTSPPPPVPATPPANSVLDVITGVVIPGALEAPPDQRRRRVTWTLLTLIAVAALAWAFPYSLDYFSTEQTTRHTKKVEESIDQEGPAFTSIVREDKSEDSRMFILDRPIGPEEIKNLFQVETGSGANFKDLEEIVASHSGQELRLPGLPEADGYAKAWLIDLFSGRNLRPGDHGHACQGCEVQACRSEDGDLV